MNDGALADACALIALFADKGARMTAAGRAAMQADVFISPVTAPKRSYTKRP